MNVMMGESQSRPTTLRRYYRSGFSFIELAIVLGIIGSLIGIIWPIGSIVGQNANVRNAVSQLNTIAQNMAALGGSGYGYNNTPATPTDITASMITMGVIPDWVVSSGTASDPWNQSGFVLWWVKGSPRIFRESFYYIPSAGVCANLVISAISCTSARSGCVQTVYTNSGHTAMTASLINETTVSGLCGANTYDGSSSNSVEFDVLM